MVEDPVEMWNPYRKILYVQDDLILIFPLIFILQSVWFSMLMM